MNKKIINTYVNYTAKNPILFFVMLIIGVLSIVILALSTKTNIMISCAGEVSAHSITVSGEFKSCTGYIYAYNDRNEGIYSFEIYETVYNEGTTTFIVKSGTEYIDSMNQHQIRIDIPIREMTIYERVFLKGGKING